MAATPQMKTGVQIVDIKYEIDGPLDQAIEKLQQLQTKYQQEGWGNLTLDVDASSDYGDSYYANVYLQGDRWETQEEADRRVEMEVIREGALRRQQRKQFEDLKKLFPNE